MIKKSFALLLLVLVMFSIFGNIGLVSADEKTSSDSLQNTKSFKQWIDTLLGKNLVTSYLSIMIFLLIVILIYSTFSYIGFPDNAGLRFLLALVVGMLASYLITTPEMIAMLQSYKALGIALIIFLPILILVFFSFVVAAKGGNFFGVMAQKIIWLIYSIYLFFVSGTALLIRWGYMNKSMVDWVKKYVGINFIPDQSNSFMLLILFIVSIVVFFIFVLNNKRLMQWVAGEKQYSDVNRVKDELQRSQALRKAEAASTRS